MTIISVNCSQYTAVSQNRDAVGAAPKKKFKRRASRNKDRWMERETIRGLVIYLPWQYRLYYIGIDLSVRHAGYHHFHEHHHHHQEQENHHQQYYYQQWYQQEQESPAGAGGFPFGEFHIGENIIINWDLGRNKYVWGFICENILDRFQIHLLVYYSVGATIKILYGLSGLGHWR